MRSFIVTNALVINGMFIDSEFFILLDGNNVLNLLDIKTSKMMIICKLQDRPTNIVLLTGYGFPRLAIEINTTFIIYKIVIPFHLWRSTATKPLKIERCETIQRAARIAIIQEDISINFVSPKTRKTISLCHTKNLGSTLDVLVDRGVEANMQNRDLVFATFTNGTICVFQTDRNPSEPKNIVKIRATCTTISEYLGQT